MSTTKKPEPSFVGAFPTDYTPGPECTAISSHNIVGIDFASSCLPDNFNNATTAYYSPGTACPSGYTAQDSCSRSTGSDATTVTCCPVRGQVTMWCIDDDATVKGPWAKMMCTWSAGDEVRIFDVTSTKENRQTTIEPVTFRGGEGINALGLKMVYGPTDLATGTSTATSGSPAAATSAQTTGDAAGADDNGLPTGATVAIAVVVPVVVIAALVGAFIWYRRRRQRYGTVGSTAGGDDLKELPPNTAGGAASYPNSTAVAAGAARPPGSDYAPSELHAAPAPQELPSQTFVSELPADVPQATSPSSGQLSPDASTLNKGPPSPNVHHVAPGS